MEEEWDGLKNELSEDWIYDNGT